MAFSRAVKNCWYGCGSLTGVMLYVAFALTNDCFSPLGLTVTVIRREYSYMLLQAYASMCVVSVAFVILALMFEGVFIKGADVLSPVVVAQ